LADLYPDIFSMYQEGKRDPTDTVTSSSSSHHHGGSVKPAEDLTPWQRLSRTLTFATTRIEPGEPVGRALKLMAVTCLLQDTSHGSTYAIPRI
jgi:hypothetical protein